MTFVPQSLARLQFLARVATKESRHLQSTDQRLFAERFTEIRAGNLDRAERLGFITAAESWLAMRQLRNQMVH